MNGSSMRLPLLAAAALSWALAQSPAPSGAVTAAAQQLPPDSVTFKSETRAVQINVSVKDAKGSPVRGLHKEDFAVTDSGKPREIQLFSGDEEGSVAQTTTEPPNGVFSNRFGHRTAQGRITAIVMDAGPPVTSVRVVRSAQGGATAIVTGTGVGESHTDQELARENAIRAVERMQTGETLAVYAICPELRVLHDYTSDREAILGSLRAFTPVTFVQQAWSPDPYAKELSALRDVAAHMSEAPGRKSVVWISRAFPGSAMLNPGFLASYHATVEAFNEANVALYVVDLAGVVGLDSNVQGMMGFANETGGRAYYMRNDMDQEIAEAIDETQYTYELGFYLSDADFDGKFHQLTVKVPGQPRLSLQYRRGYSASPNPSAAERKPELDRELLDATDSSGVGIDATLKIIPGVDGKELQVSLALDATTLGIGKDGTAAVDEMFVETGVTGELAGKIEEGLQLDLPAGLQTVRYARTMKLPEGAATLKIVVRDKATGHIGSLTIPLAGLGP
jgi:VWFA-related protein